MTIQSVIISALAFVTLFEVSARAEIRESANVHFTQSVAAGTTWLPAGDYRVSLVSMQSNQAMLKIENNETRAAIFVPASRIMVPAGRTAERTEAILHVTDGKAHLATFWFEGESYGYTVIGGGPDPEAHIALK
jgi:hypothetical protein